MEGGDCLKFSDVIFAVATFGVIDLLIDYALAIVLIPSIGSYWGINSSFVLSALIAGLVVGIVFAGNIQEESRTRAVGKIAILLGALEAIVVVLSASANGYYDIWVKEALQSMFSTSAWTTLDWYVYSTLALISGAVLNIVLVLVLVFIGVYAGSMFRKSKKT